MRNIVGIFVLLQIVFVYADDGWFWHVTDFHYDPTYLDNAISCETNASERGMFGYNWCDSPWKLITSSIDAMHENKADVDFIIWTGDSTPHVKDNVTSHEIYRNIISNITAALKTKFNSNSTPVYAVFGNHDYYPAHQFPPNNNLMYNEIYEDWKDWIQDPTQKQNFQRGAYYTLKTKTGIRIMALNTNMYYRSDKISMKYRYSDPADQFQWMADTLQYAKDNNEKVIIISHVPPGIIPEELKPWMYEQFNYRFNEIILEYSDVITGLYFGHEHVDTFRIYYKSDSPVLVKLCAPSVTPWTYIRPNGEAEPTRNPGIRLVRYDRSNGLPKEIIQYYLDLKNSNTNKHANWTVEYTMPRDYNMNDLSAQSFDGLVKKMRAHNSAEFADYALRRYIGGSKEDKRVNSCVSNTCKVPYICAIEKPDLREFMSCFSQSSIPVGRK